MSGLLVRPDQLADEYAIDFSNVHRLRLERDGRFPRRVYMSDRTVAYIREEMDAYAKKRIAESRAADARRAAEKAAEKKAG